jgi:hypothetical protein
MILQQELEVQIDNLLKLVESQAVEHQHHIKYLNKIIDSQRRLIDKFRSDFRLIQVVVGEGIAPAAEEHELN